MNTIDFTVHDSELALLLARAGIRLYDIEDSEDGSVWAASVDPHEARHAAAALLRMVGANPGLGPDFLSAIAHLME